MQEILYLQQSCYYYNISYHTLSNDNDSILFETGSPNCRWPCLRSELLVPDADLDPDPDSDPDPTSHPDPTPILTLTLILILIRTLRSFYGCCLLLRASHYKFKSEHQSRHLTSMQRTPLKTYAEEDVAFGQVDDCRRVTISSS